MGSADLMRRNLLNRVEVVFPVLDPRIQWRVLRVLQTDLSDVKNSWALRGDASYQRLWDALDAQAFDSHVQFMSDSFGLCDAPD